MPLAFLVRRSTPDSTSAWATAKGSTPGVLSPVDTPSSVRHTPSSGDDVRRWCLPVAAAAPETLPPKAAAPAAAAAAADADALGRWANKAGSRRPAAVVGVSPPPPVPPEARDLQRAADPSAKCNGDRAPGVEISTSTSSSPHDDAAAASDVLRGPSFDKASPFVGSTIMPAMETKSL